MADRRGKLGAPRIGTAGVKRKPSRKITRRMHDTIGMAAGKIDSVSAARAPTVALRAKRLAAFGFRLNPAIFGTPTHRLTPQAPYHATPEAWLDAFEGLYMAGPGADQIWWRLPFSFIDQYWPACNFIFRGLAAGPAVLSLSFDVWPVSGKTGYVVVDIGDERTQIAVAAPAVRIVDIGFMHEGGDVDARVFFRPGIYDFVFRSAALLTGGIVITPPPVEVMARKRK
jgi:hypothetical protein